MATRRHDGRGDGVSGCIDRQTVFEDLFDTLAVARAGAHPHRMATHLLRRASGSTRLVALVDDCRRAVYFDPDDGAVTLVPFDEHGPADGRELIALRTESGPTTWVERNEADATWVHPRYRTSGAD